MSPRLIPDTEISERGQILLKALVQRYVRDGTPVGSRTLLEESGLPVSPATVRNVMADLEERGLVSSPHTSAGRVPTAHGYRLFVDHLVAMQPLERRALENLREALNPNRSGSELVASASQLLSDISRQVGLVTIPRHNQRSLRQVEFLPLSDNRVLVILVINNREVENRVIHTRRAYGERELQQAANLINQRFAGRSLDAVRAGLFAAMQADRDRIDSALQTSLDLAARAFGDEEQATVRPWVLSGESQLVGATRPEELDKLRDLFDAFQHKRDILELVDRCIGADEVQIFIGEEAGFHVLGDFSVITAPYSAENEKLGVLAVIGPTRMDYERVIPVVDVTAKTLSRALSLG